MICEAGPPCIRTIAAEECDDEGRMPGTPYPKEQMHRMPLSSRPALRSRWQCNRAEVRCEVAEKRRLMD